MADGRRGTGDPAVSRSRTPELTRVKARVAGSDPAAAARSFLADRSSTYHISDPARDLRTVSHASENGVTTVRLAQRYRGLPVVGAQYVVRMKDEGASNLVSGTSGQYFSDLGVDTSHPLRFAPARRAALHWLTTTVRWRGTPTVTDHGSAVVPVGKGVLTRHVTVSGYDNARRTPVRQQMYIHAHTGKVVYAVSGFAGRKVTIKEYDSVSGLKRTLGVIASPRGSFMADLNVEDHHIAFQLDKHPESPRSGIVVMNRDGSARHWLIKDTEARAPMLPMLTATDEAVSFTSVDFHAEWLDTYLRQLPYAGGATKRVSCSNAYKGAPASDSGTGVTWVDFTGGRSQIVNRETPVGSCG
jgi:hypothetical protein